MQCILLKQSFNWIHTTSIINIIITTTNDTIHAPWSRPAPLLHSAATKCIYSSPNVCFIQELQPVFRVDMSYCMLWSTVHLPFITKSWELKPLLCSVWSTNCLTKKCQKACRKNVVMVQRQSVYESKRYVQYVVEKRF